MGSEKGLRRGNPQRGNTKAVLIYPQGSELKILNCHTMLNLAAFPSPLLV